MEAALIGLLMFGEAWFLVYGLSLLISLAIVVPKVARLRQPVLPWVLACVAFPVVTAGVVNWKVD